MGINICGLNGAGKSTLGKTLAEKLKFFLIDMEDLYFPKTSLPYAYGAPRTREEVENLLFSGIKSHENFVLVSIKGDYGEAIRPFLKYAVLVYAPKDIRLKRVKNRSFQKFGNRMLPGGEIYEQEEGFFELVKSRNEDIVEEWTESLSCPILRVDGTNPVDENMKIIIDKIEKLPK